MVDGHSAKCARGSARSLYRPVLTKWRRCAPFPPREERHRFHRLQICLKSQALYRDALQGRRIQHRLFDASAGTERPIRHRAEYVRLSSGFGLGLVHMAPNPGRFAARKLTRTEMFVRNDMSPPVLLDGRQFDRCNRAQTWRYAEYFSSATSTQYMFGILDKSPRRYLRENDANCQRYNVLTLA